MFSFIHIHIYPHKYAHLVHKVLLIFKSVSPEYRIRSYLHFINLPSLLVYIKPFNPEGAGISHSCLLKVQSRGVRNKTVGVRGDVLILLSNMKHHGVKYQQNIQC